MLRLTKMGLCDPGSPKLAIPQWEMLGMRLSLDAFKSFNLFFWDGTFRLHFFTYFTFRLGNIHLIKLENDSEIISYALEENK